MLQLLEYQLYDCSKNPYFYINFVMHRKYGIHKLMWLKIFVNLIQELVTSRNWRLRRITGKQGKDSFLVGVAETDVSKRTYLKLSWRWHIRQPWRLRSLLLRHIVSG